MAEEEKKVKMTEVPTEVLVKMQEQMAELERKAAEQEAKTAGMEEIFSKGAEGPLEPKLRTKKNFEPKFRTVRLRKYSIAGDIDNLGYVIGWTSRGAYEVVDRSGTSPQIVNMIDVIFYGQEKNKDGKIKAESIKLLDLLNNGKQIHCKILEEKREKIEVPTGEEIDVTVFDPAHGLISTGEKVDGIVAYSEIKYKLQVPGIDQPIWIDSTFCN